MEKTELIVKCTDNCSCLSIDKFEDEPMYYITTELKKEVDDMFYNIEV